MTVLYDRQSLEVNSTSLSAWQNDAFRCFSDKLTNNKDKFPCIPATVGFKLNQFRYGFVGDPRLKITQKEFAKLLSLFGEKYHTFGSYTSLIVFFDTVEELAEDFSIDNYRILFWRILENVSRIDDQDWPQHIPKDPHHHVWEYCFGGEQYFIYCATPAHIHRKSRQFPYFIFAITPRSVLEHFNSTPQKAEKVKKQIRKRLKAYDTIEVHPDLSIYGGEENFEWKQYFLNDDNSSPSRCPYSYVRNSLKKIRK